MCTCIAEIKASYTKVRHQTAEVAQQQLDIDDYLDKVIVVRKNLERITEATNSLVETVRDHFTVAGSFYTDFNIDGSAASKVGGVTSLSWFENHYRGLL